MDTDSLHYDLPVGAVAQRPVEPRDAARLLVDAGPGRAPCHHNVRDLASFVGPGDVVVLNETRVLPARLRLRKGSGAAVEVLLLEPEGAPWGEPWTALVRPSRRVAPGTTLTAGPDLRVVVDGRLGDGRRRVRLDAPGGLRAALERHGELPLPPYIREALTDPQRYQTVYARPVDPDEARGESAAAPTAGLHLTMDLLAELRARGARVEPVELVVGAGTFRPIEAERVEDHRMHAERYVVPASTWQACREADRVVAVGTTAVRALESVARTGRLDGRTDLFLWGDPPFEVVDVLLTNFHQPRSSLLALVDAFVGPRWRELYDEALATGYRFLSFGDAMLLRRER